MFRRDGGEKILALILVSAKIQNPIETAKILSKNYFPGAV